jgi:hypothetical protein
MLISHIQFSRLSQLERFIALDLPPGVGDLELIHDIENLLESLHHVYVFPGLDDSINEFIGNEFGRHEYLPTRVSRVCLTRMEKLVPDISLGQCMMVIGLLLPILRQRWCCLLYDVY